MPLIHHMFFGSTHRESIPNESNDKTTNDYLLRSQLLTRKSSQEYLGATTRRSTQKHVWNFFFFCELALKSVDQSSKVSTLCTDDDFKILGELVDVDVRAQVFFF